MNEKLGLLRFIPLLQQDKIKSNLGVTFEDVQDSMETLRLNIQSLEEEIRMILYGENYGEELSEHVRKRI